MNKLNLMRFFYLSHFRAVKSQARLCICTVSPELSHLAYTMYGSRVRFRQKFRPLALPDMSVCLFNTFLASDNFCPLLITFANSLDLDQDRHDVRPDLSPSCLTL